MKTYLSNALLRPSCYKCNSKGLKRNSDITLADFWGVNEVMPEMFDDRGTSLVFINAEKGKRIFDEIKVNCVFQETNTHSAIKYNPSAYISSPRPLKRKKIIKNMDKWDFKELQLQCGKKTYFEKVYHKLRKILKRKK